MELENPQDSVSSFPMSSYLSAPLLLENVVLPVGLIMAGKSGQRALSPAYYAGSRVGASIGSFLSPGLHSITSTNVFGTKTIVAGKSGARLGAKVGGRVGARLIPGIGWGMLAYDVYDIAVNQRLWGFDLN